MKRILFSVLLLISATTLFAQDRDYKDNRDNRQNSDNRDNRNRDNNYQSNAPHDVQQSFQRDYPNAGNAQWDRSGKHWHATYQDKSYNNPNADAYYDRKGRHVDTHIQWDRSQLPSDYDQRVYSRYHTRDYNVYRIERPNSTPIFQLLLNLGGNSRTVYTDEHGNVVRYKDRH